MKKEAKLTDEEYNYIEKYLLTLSKAGTKINNPTKSCCNRMITLNR